MLGHLLIRKLGDQSLDDFVASLPDVLGCERWEQRQSSNYPEERYFRCLVLGLVISVSIADDDEFVEYQFHLLLNVRGFSENEDGLLAALADCVARVLALAGHEVVCPFDISRSGSGAIVYRRNSFTENVSLRDRVLTEQIR